MTEDVSKKSVLLDLRGLKCPLPVLKARRALKDIPPGGSLKILSDDPAAQLDFPHFCETTGHALISIESDDQNTLTIHLKAVHHK